MTVAGCDLQTAVGVVKHLQQQGFVVATPGRNKKAFSHSGKPMYSIVKNEDQYSRMLAEYFDPMTKISHHVSLSKRITITFFDHIPIIRTVCFATTEAPPDRADDTNTLAAGESRICRSFEVVIP